VPAGARSVERFAFKVKRAAVGKRSQVRFVASGPGIGKRSATAALRIRR